MISFHQLQLPNNTVKHAGQQPAQPNLINKHMPE
jgi:hypothetical protein